MRPAPRSLAALLLSAFATASEEKLPALPVTWDLDALYRAPEVFEAPGFTEEGVRALFYAGPPWKGKPTRIFAWYGAPRAEGGGRLPGMVLVHGGGGTAFAEWVRLWNSRGYAAIAMDLCGSTPGKAPGDRPRHERGGPPGWGGFDQIEDAIEDQWTYHAVAAIALGHSLLRSFSDVDPERTGITGISWGGYLTCIAAAVDRRFRFAAPVYGCGFLGEDSCWLPTFEKMGEKGRRWLELWDPSKYLPAVRVPLLWVTGTNDFAYPLSSLQKSYRLSPAERTLAIRVRMAHAHGGPGEKPEEIRVFADAILRGGVPLTRLKAQGLEGSRAWASFEAPVRIAKAELAFTRDAGPWQTREWHTVPAEVDGDLRTASAVVPDGATAFFLNLVDERGLVVSSEHIERPGK